MAASQTIPAKNPCYEESMASMKCLNDNNYDRSMCVMQFDNYNACKDFWMRVSAIACIS